MSKFSAEFKNTLGTGCFRHNHCISGYCKSGRCSSPSSKHHPCNPNSQNCPEDFKCSGFSRTCVPVDYMQKQPCASSSDCTFNQICGDDGRCRELRLAGSTCNLKNDQSCVMGSLCVAVDEDSTVSKCYEQCSRYISCLEGYKCTKLLQSRQDSSVCVPVKSSQRGYEAKVSNKYVSLSQKEIVEAFIIVVIAIIILLGLLYIWIRFTRGEKDPRLWHVSGKKKKKKLRLNFEGNGLATITLIPSNCQSPQPVAASQLFSEAPPAYSEDSLPTLLPPTAPKIKILSIFIVFAFMLLAAKIESSTAKNEVLDPIKTFGDFKVENDPFSVSGPESPVVTVIDMSSSTLRKNSRTLIDVDEKLGSSDGQIPKEATSASQLLPGDYKYEYPEMVKSLKSVYKDMLITTFLYILNIISAVGIVLVNKFIYSYYKFNHGMTLTLYHFAITSIGLQVLAALKAFPVKSADLLKILPLSISFCSYVVLTNLSLQYNSGTFYQILVAPTVAFLQYLLYGIKTDLKLIPPMVLMFIGVAIATLAELKPSLLGLSIAFSGIFMTAIYQILVGTKQKQLGLSAIQLLHYQAPLSTIILLVLTPFFTNPSIIFNFEYSKGLIASIVASALCAFFLNLSMYLVLGRSNALTYNVIGLSKLFLVLFLNYWLFERSEPLNKLNLLGVFLAFSGVCSFSFVKFKLILKETSQQLSKIN